MTNPPAAPDRPHTQRPVGAGPGKENADRPLLPIFRQGAEEEVDGQPNAVLLDRLGQIEDSIADAQVLIGRNNVNAVRFNGHGILCLNNLHAGVLRDEFRQQTRVGGRQVLDDNETPLRCRRAWPRKNPQSTPANRLTRLARQPGCPKNRQPIQKAPHRAGSGYETRPRRQLRPARGLLRKVLRRPRSHVCENPIYLPLLDPEIRRSWRSVHCFSKCGGCQQVGW